MGDTWLDAWAAFISRRRWLILGLWAVLVVGGLVAASDLETRLHGSVGTVAGGAADRVEQVLTHDFDTPYAQFLIITEPQGATPKLLATLQGFPVVAASRTLPAEHGASAVIVGLKTRTMAETEAQVPLLRQYLKSHGFASALVTGIAPMSLDVVKYASQESARAERTVLPLTLIALVLAFGALGAALLPLLTGLGAVVVTMGCLALIARFMPLSVYASNIATMLGLGLGIDYALFLVSRWRDERRQGATDQAALHAAIRHGTPAILASSATVLLGLIALAVVPSEETRGLGIGGLVVVLFSGLAAVTLLPALAATFGHWAEYPRWLSNWRVGGASRWVGITRWVLRRPVVAGIAAFVLLAAMALPLTRVTLGDPEMSQMPQDIEAIRAIRQLQATGNAGALIPIQILVQFPETVLTTARASGLLAIATKLRQDPRVGDVYAVADPTRGGDHLLMNLAVWDPTAVLAQLPEPLHALISRDTKSTLIYVIPSNDITLLNACRFARELTATDWRTFWPSDPGTVTVGGPLTIANEFQDLTRRYLPILLMIVAGGTFLMLLAYTRSVVIPLKAVLANLLTVGAALGGTAALFRSDLGMWLFGLESPLATLGPAIPMVTFCVVFGLSMDYEIFLLSPILEAHRRGDADADAVLAGVKASAGLITAAASVMAIVFFGFALTGFVAVKFLGIALGLGILLDATVTRLVLIPAAMLVFGKWNWWPGDPKKPPKRLQPLQPPRHWTKK